MATKVLNYFSFDKTINKTFDKEITPSKPTPVRALPAKWYTSSEFYQLERRAIFSKQWLFLTHSVRLSNTGNWLRYQIAGYDVIITKDRKGAINAFHNVCRHRAYPVIEDEGSGNKKIIACRYHGWSYGLDGKLAKAPGYHGLEFEKEENGLLKVHTRIDRNGFVWINLDAKEIPEVPWEQQFENVDIQARYEGIDFSEYVLDHEYKLDGPYNWKILSDNFNECYHCPTTHPDIPAFLNLESFDSALKDGHIQHYCKPTEEQVEKGLTAHSTYYFPASSMTVAKHFLMIQKFMPDGPNSSIMAYEIYRNKNATSDDFHLMADMYEKVMREDKVLCENAQRNLNRGVTNNGLLHPVWEKAPLFFQQTVRDVVTKHFRTEQAAGKEIWPARHRMRKETDDEFDEICDGLGCGSTKEGLVW